MPWIDSATIDDPRVQPYCTLCWEPITGLYGDLCDECREIAEWFPDDEPAWIADHILNVEEGRLCPSCMERREPDETLCPQCRAEGEREMTVQCIGPDYTRPPFCFGEWILNALEGNDVQLLAQFKNPEQVFVGMRQLHPEYRKKAARWANRWLSNSDNDCLRARGAHPWQVLSWLSQSD